MTSGYKSDQDIVLSPMVRPQKDLKLFKLSKLS